MSQHGAKRKRDSTTSFEETNEHEDMERDADKRGPKGKDNLRQQNLEVLRYLLLQCHFTNQLDRWHSVEEWKNVFAEHMLMTALTFSQKEAIVLQPELGSSCVGLGEYEVKKAEYKRTPYYYFVKVGATPPSLTNQCVADHLLKEGGPACFMTGCALEGNNEQLQQQVSDRKWTALVTNCVSTDSASEELTFTFRQLASADFIREVSLLQVAGQKPHAVQISLKHERDHSTFVSYEVRIDHRGNKEYVVPRTYDDVLTLLSMVEEQWDMVCNGLRRSDFGESSSGDSAYTGELWDKAWKTEVLEAVGNYLPKEGKESNKSQLDVLCYPLHCHLAGLLLPRTTSSDQVDMRGILVSSPHSMEYSFHAVGCKVVLHRGDKTRCSECNHLYRDVMSKRLKRHAEASVKTPSKFTPHSRLNPEQMKERVTQQSAELQHLRMLYERATKKLLDSEGISLPPHQEQCVSDVLMYLEQVLEVRVGSCLDVTLRVKLVCPASPYGMHTARLAIDYFYDMSTFLRFFLFINEGGWGYMGIV
jgi:hypothetical protein